MINSDLISEDKTAPPKEYASGVPVFCSHDRIVDVNNLIPNPDNPNQHPENQIKLLGEIIKAQGWRSPITVSIRSGMIVRGHGKLAAALHMGFDTVPVDFQNYNSDAEEWADLIADNRIAEFSEINDELLADMLAKVDIGEVPIEITGYSREEYGDLVAAMTEKSALMEMSDDIAPNPPLQPFTQEGDVWHLGDHILVCGDSTKSNTYRALMGKEKAQLCITDPPYNVDYEGTAGKIKNDKQSDHGFKRFLIDAFTLMRRYSLPGAAAYIFHADTEGINFRTAFIEAGFMLKQCLVWVKNHFVLGRQDYQWMHEPILYGWVPGASHYFIDNHSQRTVIEDNSVEIDKLKKDELVNFIKSRIPAPESCTSVIREDKPLRSTEHPTMKPVRLVARLINNSSKKGWIVLDPFGGSGSTLIACEHLGRKCRTIELDTRFCDVIVKRYHAVTGKRDITCTRGGKEIPSAVIDFFIGEEMT